MSRRGAAGGEDGTMTQSYIRGPYAQAACALIDHLRSNGVVVTVGYPSAKRNRTLYVYVREGAAEQVPETWGDFKVITEVEDAEILEG